MASRDSGRVREREERDFGAESQTAEERAAAALPVSGMPNPDGSDRRWRSLMLAGVETGDAGRRGSLQLDRGPRL
ncbi:hypothetical protein LOZ48_001775, partial [Ophidiomyces ophidiicola]